MTDLKSCPECGQALPADAPNGLCPECLLKRGLESGFGSEGMDRTVLSSGFVPPEPAELNPHFPHLEILSLVGKGGMGAVYKARQKHLDRTVAVKILPPEVGKDPAFAERFVREAKALAHLSHPNIVAVYDFGQTNGLYYFIMEYIDGANLRETIRGGNLTPEAALAIVPQICEALQFAHDEGIVHRDIKPENILVDKRGRVKIADFGLAKLLGQSVPDVGLTNTQQVMGTLHYMAPEQMKGAKEVDHRADIYSLGVVFYEMLTGQLPLGRFEPPSKRVHLDVRLDEIVLRTLEQEPGRRYQHASEVKTELDGLRGLPAEARQRLLAREFRTKATIFGWPLVHIAFGVDPYTGKARVAKGIIAIGDTAVGVFAAGGSAFGGITFGGIAAGLISFGGMSLGLLLALGGLAVGGFAWGGCSLGIVALGGVTAGMYAFGGQAYGLHTLSSIGKDPEAVRFFEPWAYNWPQWMTGMTIVFPLLGLALYLTIWTAFWFQRRAEEQKAKVPEDKSTDERETLRQQVCRPAIGLMLTGILDWIAIPLVMLYLMAGDTAPRLTLGLIALGAFLATGFMLFGAFKIMQLEGYGFGIIACLLAMLITPGNLIGLPLGIWALATLTRRDVRAAFRSPP